MTAKRVAILGSTGSIGTQALDVISAHSERFSVEVLCANNNAALLIDQAKRFLPNAVVIGNKDKYQEVSESLYKYPIKVFAGSDSIAQIVARRLIIRAVTRLSAAPIAAAR